MKDPNLLHLNSTSSSQVTTALSSAFYTVRSVKSTSSSSSPPPPFITSTMQMASNRALGLSASETMRSAQSLYEAGHISYMRTDNANMSPDGVIAAREAAKDRYGPENVREEEEGKKKKKKNKVRAHFRCCCAKGHFFQHCFVSTQISTPRTPRTPKKPMKPSAPPSSKAPVSPTPPRSPPL